MRIWPELALLTAAVIGLSAIYVSARARALLGRSEPPSGAALVRLARAEALSDSASARTAVLDAERRAALGSMDLLVFRARSMARVALAAGSACGLLALTAMPERGLGEAALLALGCFAAGALGSAVSARLGHAAYGQRGRFRDRWKASHAEASALLRSGAAEPGGAGEWTDPVRAE